ncbi:MAG TPA: DinB family protein [Candidatus Acidoferrales bacterium]|nr:DinB family protein [Candidatus Acidoferrales bacterium]
MKLRRTLVLSMGLCMVLASASATFSQAQSSGPAKDVRDNFFDINRKILDMAKDFPEDKYDFRLRPEMRSFGEVIVHVASGIVYAAKKGRGESVRWTELDPKDYKTKADVVAMLEKAIDDSAASIKALPDDSFTKTVEPWLDVTEHSAEHYGLLVAYFRANGIVPPESRPKK